MENTGTNEELSSPNDVILTIDESSDLRDCWALPADLHHKVFQEFGETIESMKANVADLRSRLVQNVDSSRLENFDLSDTSLLRFLRGKKFRVDKAYDVILNNIQFRETHPDWFQVNKEEIEVFVNMIHVSNTVDANLRRTIIILPFKCIPLLTSEYLAKHPKSLTRFRIWLFNKLSYDPYAQLCGIVLISSFQQLNFWDTTRLSQVSSVYEHAECVKYVTKCAGFRIKALMIFEEPFFFSFVWAAVSLILSDKIRSRFNICGADYSKLRDHVTHMERLPVCLGGNGDEDFLADNWIVHQHEQALQK